MLNPAHLVKVLLSGRRLLLLLVAAHKASIRLQPQLAFVFVLHNRNCGS